MRKGVEKDKREVTHQPDGWEKKNRVLPKRKLLGSCGCVGEGKVGFCGCEVGGTHESCRLSGKVAWDE